MPLILDSHDINSWTAHIFEDARKGIVIICPYLAIGGRLRRTMEMADAEGVPIFVVYGKREMERDTYEWLAGLRHSSIGVIRDLHAKLYMNEDRAVISSMNLYEYSRVNNEELGVGLGRREDREAFRDVTFQAMRLMEMCRKEHGDWDVGDLDRPLRQLMGRGKDYRAAIMATANAERREPERILCHCIRCGRVIPSDHPYVYCGRCMDSWSRYGNLDYAEDQGRCYICGAEGEFTAVRPACPRCYAANRDLVDDRCDSMRAVARAWRQRSPVRQRIDNLMRRFPRR